MARDPKAPSGNKGIIFILLAGFLLLTAAGIVLFRRTHSAPDSKKANTSTTPDVFKLPAPLVVEEKQRPIPALPQDTGEADTAPADTGEGKQSTARGTASGASTGRMGTIDPAELAKFINSKFAAVRMCYEKRLKVNPMLQGVVDLRISLSPKGTVTHLNVNNDSVGDPPMLQCVKSTVRGWRFPKPDGGRVVFDKPFHFKKKN